MNKALSLVILTLLITATISNTYTIELRIGSNGFIKLWFDNLSLINEVVISIKYVFRGQNAKFVLGVVTYNKTNYKPIIILKDIRTSTDEKLMIESLINNSIVTLRKLRIGTNDVIVILVIRHHEVLTNVNGISTYVGTNLRNGSKLMLLIKLEPAGYFVSGATIDIYDLSIRINGNRTNIPSSSWRYIMLGSSYLRIGSFIIGESNLPNIAIIIGICLSVLLVLFIIIRKFRP